MEGGVKRCTRSCHAKPCIDVVAGFCIVYYSLMVLPANVGCLSLCERIKIAEIICQKVKVGRAFSAKGELSLGVSLILGVVAQLYLWSPEDGDRLATWLVRPHKLL